MICKVLASFLIALSLVQASFGKHISVAKDDKPSIELVKKIGESINLNLKEPYVDWFKSSDINLGEVFFEDDYHKIGRITGEAFKSLTIKKANYTDAGISIYHGINLNNQEKTPFNIFLYDLEHHKSLLIYDEKATDLAENSGSSRKKQLEIELKSFEEQEKLNFKYRKEAMPLDALLVNGKKVESTNCNEKGDDLLVKCLEVNLGEHVPFEKCKNKASLVFGYEYEHGDKFTGIDIKKLSFEAEITVKYPPKIEVREEIILYEDPSTALKLDCETSCANPSENLKYEWTLGDKVIHDSSSHYELTFASLELEEHSAEIVCTVRNGVDAGDHLKESQKVFKIHSSKEPDTTTHKQSTTTHPDTTPSANTNPPSNATSEFGFFGNVYNKVKFFVQFVI